ncbi:hypothetical protein SAMN06265365_102235 [Tistlia consotensis]|uniref:DUF4139 domain-containing protein n=1 Tax=Tistlia consotensis USBA 355 TaxID=560819 RepID=A0A1Y6BJZ4_9PROT|nr:DUF4139 domain-containing protein [Tistlia consotensis]SMF07658.1 hypothetical protein SAMN05428998_10481 [Tistlia consotensis USBA 355]SNR35768.1 hypothetical protein SAMN06265365_102235 [Tistlia consotensis]
MRPSTLLLAATLALPLATAGALHAETATTVPIEARRSLALTVYQNGLGLVEETRWVPLLPGENRLDLYGISQRIVAPSLTVAAQGVSLRDQAWRPADLTPQRLLESALGGKVRLVHQDPKTGETVTEPAVLLSLAGGPVLRVGDRIEIDPPGRIVLDRLPEGLSPEPRLSLTLDAGDGGPRELGLAYLVDGLSWQADYVAELNPAGDALELTGLLTVSNGTDVAFEKAALTVVAGEVSRQQRAPQPFLAAAPKAMRSEMAATDSLPAPQATGERYLYDTGRKVDLARGETQQLVLFQGLKVAAERRLRFDGLVSAGGGPEEIGPVQPTVLVGFENPKGPDARPLPAGTLRLYETSGGKRLFAGEVAIPRTPAGGKVELPVGEAFDVTGTAKVTALERLSDKAYEVAQEITLASAKDEPVEVELAGQLPRGWKMLQESRPHELESANHILWRVKIPAGGEAKVTYRLRVSR